MRRLGSRSRQPFQPAPRWGDDGQGKEEERRRGYGSGDRAGKENHEGALGNDQALPQRALTAALWSPKPVFDPGHC